VGNNGEPVGDKLRMAEKGLTVEKKDSGVKGD
jgi:hypothetical protein